MLISDIIKAAQNTIIDQKKIDDLNKKLAQASVEYEKQVQAKALYENFLSRKYTL